MRITHCWTTCSTRTEDRVNKFASLLDATSDWFDSLGTRNNLRIFKNDDGEEESDTSCMKVEKELFLKKEHQQDLLGFSFSLTNW